MRFDSGMGAGLHLEKFRVGVERGVAIGDQAVTRDEARCPTQHSGAERDHLDRRGLPLRTYDREGDGGGIDSEEEVDQLLLRSPKESGDLDSEVLAHRSAT